MVVINVERGVVLHYVIKGHPPQVQIDIQLYLKVPDSFKEVSILVVDKMSPHSKELSEIQIPLVYSAS